MANNLQARIFQSSISGAAWVGPRRLPDIFFIAFMETAYDDISSSWQNLLNPEKRQANDQPALILHPW